MTRLFFRFVGLLFLAGAFAALIVDGTRSISSGSLEILPLGRGATKVAPELFVKLHTVLEIHTPLLWDPVLVTILLLPAWLVFGGLGFLLMVLTRPRTPKIGYSRR
jgi:hypothetical protein